MLLVVLFAMHLLPLFRVFFMMACVAALAGATCWSAVVYHAAATAFATGVGDTGSAAVCVYSRRDNTSVTGLDNECAPPCKALLTAVWGDCYCRDPAYRPLAWDADALVHNLSVAQVFLLLAAPRPVASATCRTWLNDNRASWQCPIPTGK